MFSEPISLQRRFIPARAGNTAQSIVDGTAVRGSSPRVRGTCSCRRYRGSDRTVHPRACGEHASSIAHDRGMIRFIPARAGNTAAGLTAVLRRIGSSPRVRGTLLVRCRSILSMPVHPRACGEHSPVLIGDRARAGSSPRVRGTLTVELPADAVMTGSSPRVRGTCMTSGLHGSPEIGSSPRVRGTCRQSQPCSACTRFIPARAGNMCIVRLASSD